MPTSTSSSAATGQDSAHPVPDDAIVIRPTSGTDGAHMWRLARESGALDLNSSYAYLQLAQDFGQSCRIAERDGEALGFVLAYPPSARPGHLFVWQVAVSVAARGEGLAGRMIDDLLDDPAVEYLEATVTEDNAGSRALFAGIARRRAAELVWIEHLRSEDFPDAGHDAEPMLRIGPLGPR
ncbi:diaminobutyrate acetyltransferase [Bogoriella caseilytica]|uniref:L-2,4-diaminobutyric acid acetyltransferase n=1 Tax=Bogoriella caseilytica TaxID=56055 RepID=A0A3N2B9Q5_9MICO|nr:diaminobutyrate acetyltransferase [Bogoriella caseilytica]ROR71986.1 diaminobutyrate acetyltransferase [Bogoriella caseilytica]